MDTFLRLWDSKLSLNFNWYRLVQWISLWSREHEWRQTIWMINWGGYTRKIWNNLPHSAGRLKIKIICLWESYAELWCCIFSQLKLQSMANIKPAYWNVLVKNEGIKLICPFTGTTQDAHLRIAMTTFSELVYKLLSYPLYHSELTQWLFPVPKLREMYALKQIWI